MPIKTQVDLVERIAREFSLEYSKIDSFQTGYRNKSYKVTLNDQLEVNLIIFKAEPEIRDRVNRADGLTEFLSTFDIPVRCRVDLRLLYVSLGERRTVAAVYNYLPGSTISWEAYTKNHIKLLGATMGKIHAAACLDSASNINKVLASQVQVNDETRQLLDRIELYFSQEPVRRAARAKLGLDFSVDFNSFNRVIDAVSHLPHQHALHMDLVRGNILFSNSGGTTTGLQLGNVMVSGIIDFEKTAYGNRLFDLARTLAFLMVDCKHKTTKQIRKYFLYSGYIKRGAAVPFSSKELQLLDQLVRIFLVHDLYKFMLHNPYEFLAQNEHYVRTRDILVSQGVLKYNKTELKEGE